MGVYVRLQQVGCGKKPIRQKEDTDKAVEAETVQELSRTQ